jgi:hypothetical protein
MQTAAPGEYSGAIDVVRKTIAKQGPAGFVRSLPSSQLAKVSIACSEGWPPRWSA